MSLEDQAEQIARQIATETAQSGRLPVDPGHIARLSAVIRAARRDGHDAAMREVLDAWHLFIEDDKDGALEVFVEQLGDIAGPAVVKEMKKGSATRRAKCVYCGRSKPVTKAGKIRKHYITAG